MKNNTCKHDECFSSEKMLLDNNLSTSCPLPAPTAALPAAHNPRCGLNAAKATNLRSRPPGAARSLLAGRSRREAAANQRAPAEPPPGRAQRPPVQRLLRITAVSGGERRDRQLRLLAGSAGGEGLGPEGGSDWAACPCVCQQGATWALSSALSVCKARAGAKRCCSLKLHRCFARGSEEQHCRSTVRLSGAFLNLLLTGQKCVTIGPNVRS